MKTYLWNIFVSIDQLINTILGGDPDETISSRMGKALKRCSLCRFICKLIHPFDKNHCQKSVENDEGSDEKWSWG